MARQNPVDDSCLGVIVRGLTAATLIALALVGLASVLLA